MTRPRTALLALLAATAVVVAVLVRSGPPSKPNNADASTSSRPTTVQRRNLVATDTESGTLSYANSYTVYNHLSGTVTSLPAVGEVIRPGQALYKVGNEPVILFDGSTPAYRDLDPSDSAGPDILELNRTLVRLGFDQGGIAVDDEWQSATTEGVDLFQESLGETETGDLKLGQVVFLPGAQLISSVSATLGSDGGGSTPTSASYDPPAGRPNAEFVSLSRPSGSGSGTAPSPSRPCKPKRHKKQHCKPSDARSIAALTALLKAETAELKAKNGPTGSTNPSSKSPTSSAPPKTTTSPSTPSSTNPSGASATAIMQTSSTQLVATVNLDATKQSEAKVGERVQVELPSGNTVNGKVTAVSPVAQNSNSNNNTNTTTTNNNNNNTGGSVIPVTISLSGRHLGTGLDQAAVSVNFSQAEANNVLSVPVTALLATSGGNYAVQEAAAPHRLIPVTTGLFAAGFVQISGSGIYQGLEVTDSQG